MCDFKPTWEPEPPIAGEEPVILTARRGAARDIGTHGAAQLTKKAKGADRATIPCLCVFALGGTGTKARRG